MLFELVVTGTRGHGGFAGLLLGSVSHALAANAHCPAVIVRGEDPGRPLHRSAASSKWQVSGRRLG
jgi:hypothetical protein